MFIIQSYSLAVFFCIITMICWGSWANTQKLAASTWRFELFYWDYVIGIILFSLLFAFTLGSIGDSGRSFMADLNQASGPSLFSAFIGGVLFNAANILLVAAIAIAGMSVAFPVGIGLALVVGVIVNYLAAPVGNSLFLFTGVALVGNIGSAEMRSFTVVGDAVNVASRLETSGEPGTVRIGETTYLAIADRVDVVSLGVLELKGKEKPTVAYRLDRIISSPARSETGVGGLREVRDREK